MTPLPPTTPPPAGTQTLIHSEPKLHMAHHPADIARINAREAQWRAERRRLRLQAWAISLGFLAVIVGGIIFLFST